ncbi:MAG: hypothetical protein U1E21_13775 [Reyranellaceae bacterium]
MSILRHLPYAILSAGLLAAGGASAQSMWSIDQREANQQERIEQGRRNGSLTREEYYRLEQGQNRIENYERRARADGVVTRQERQQLDNMLDRQGRQIYRETHDSERTGWGDRNGRNGRHGGWTQGEHNGWDGSRPPGIERRDARAEHRIDNGRQDGSLTQAEANRLQHQQNRIDRYEGRARADGNVSPGERNRINTMQNQQSRDIYNARHNDRTVPPTGTQPAGSRNGGGGWQSQPQPQTSTSMPAAVTQPSGGNRTWGGNNGGWSMRSTSAPQATAAPTMTRTTAPSGGGRRH